MLSDKEIYDNRLKWINYLKHPDTKKAKGYLDRGNGERCCLGHGCFVLNIENSYSFRRTTGDTVNGYDGEMHYAPQSFIDMVGLWERDGQTRNGKWITIEVLEEKSLSRLNDYTDATPQEIGFYLESVIMGGAETPFKKLEISLD